MTTTTTEERHYSGVTSRGALIDSILDDLFGGKRSGYFIELGANDGLSQSNSAFFEFHRDWTGVLVEPSPAAYAACVAARPASKCFNAACVAGDYNGSTVKGDFTGNLMSSVNGTRLHSDVAIEVPARTLESILDEAGCDGNIDFMSLDTEGYELNVLRGLNLARYRPTCILIEVYTKDYDEICEFMTKNNYMLHSNVTGYNHTDNPYWDGTHNDYLFVRI